LSEVARLRKEHGLSQERLAELSGVNRATIGMIEVGKRTPTLQTLSRLAAALDVEPGELLPKDEPQLFPIARPETPEEQEYRERLRSLSLPELHAEMDRLADELRRAADEHGVSGIRRVKSPREARTPEVEQGQREYVLLQRQYLACLKEAESRVRTRGPRQA
jgi:transcriptional regulator with XRE-family HTH domain